jgi:uncharacterized surface protein with fasciclin (FAS1) repeats
VTSPNISFTHQVDGLEGYSVEGQVLEMKDLYDGMVLTSISGYPLIVQLNPFRVNNVSISTTQRDVRYQNAVVHSFLRYPVPLVPWIGKSMVDVLIETSDANYGHMSGFLALLNASPDTQALIQESRTNGTTLFVPTNAALAALNNSLTDDPTKLQKLLLNHMVSGNFARRCWQASALGNKVSDTELKLDSRAGEVLVLDMNDDVIINGRVRVIHGDIFSEDGVMHVIDSLLLPSSFLVGGTTS